MSAAEKMKIYDSKGQLIREGQMRHSDNEKYFLGIAISDYFKAGSILISSTIVGTMLWVNLNNRVEMNTQGIMSLTENNSKILKILTDYTTTLDSFLSAAYGTQFQGGRPINPLFKGEPFTHGG